LTWALFLIRLFTGEFNPPTQAGLRARARLRARAKQNNHCQGLLHAQNSQPRLQARLFLFEEIFRIVKLGAKFTVTFAGSEGAKVSQPDKIAFF